MHRHKTTFFIFCCHGISSHFWRLEFRKVASFCVTIIDDSVTYIASPVFDRIRFASKRSYISTKIVKVQNMFILKLDALIQKLLKTLDLGLKYDCLRKVKNGVFSLCMIWKLCDSDQTTGKQRASEMFQNK